MILFATRTKFDEIVFKPIYVTFKIHVLLPTISFGFTT